MKLKIIVNKTSKFFKSYVTVNYAIFTESILVNLDDFNCNNPFYLNRFVGIILTIMLL